VEGQSAAILEFKSTIHTREETIGQLENARSICLAEIERLKEVNEKKDKYKEVIAEKERDIATMARRQRELEDEIAMANSKARSQAEQMDYLHDTISEKKA
jgi:chromosome segregation ATPase